MLIQIQFMHEAREVSIRASLQESNLVGRELRQRRVSFGGGGVGGGDGCDGGLLRRRLRPHHHVAELPRRARPQVLQRRPVPFIGIRSFREMISASARQSVCRKK